MISYLEKYQKISLFIAVLIAIFIFYISSLHFEKGTPMEIELIPTIYHLGIFFLLAFFLIPRIVGKRKNKLLILSAILIAILYAISDEFHQLFVSNRYCSIGDFLLDSIGIAFSTLIYLIVRIKKKI
ncbi:MAG: VanZ family protein [Nanoarchaeota archaeon]|nr:VanZ family protein [Nanoarchaeota archaeon]